MVDAWQVRSLDAYREIPRVGRRTRLASCHREALWPVFERSRAELPRAVWAVERAGLQAGGRRAPVSMWIRELLDHGLAPQVFVLERLPPHQDWRGAERSAIERWRTWPDSDLPYVHPPQTPKSTAVEIREVSLLNVQAGGWAAVQSPQGFGRCEGIRQSDRETLSRCGRIALLPPGIDPPGRRTLRQSLAGLPDGSAAASPQTVQGVPDDLVGRDGFDGSFIEFASPALHFLDPLRLEFQPGFDAREQSDRQSLPLVRRQLQRLRFQLLGGHDFLVSGHSERYAPALLRGRGRRVTAPSRSRVHRGKSMADRDTGIGPDGNHEDRTDTVSVFNGPPPLIGVHPDEDAKTQTVATWLAARTRAQDDEAGAGSGDARSGARCGPGRCASCLTRICLSALRRSAAWLAAETPFVRVVHHHGERPAASRQRVPAGANITPQAAPLRRCRIHRHMWR